MNPRYAVAVDLPLELAARLQCLVDDMPMISGDAGRPFWDLIPVENIEHVEGDQGRFERFIRHLRSERSHSHHDRFTRKGTGYEDYRLHRILLIPGGQDP